MPAAVLEVPTCAVGMRISKVRTLMPDQAADWTRMELTFEAAQSLAATLPCSSPQPTGPPETNRAASISQPSQILNKARTKSHLQKEVHGAVVSQGLEPAQQLVGLQAHAVQPIMAPGPRGVLLWRFEGHLHALRLAWGQIPHRQVVPAGTCGWPLRLS